MDDDDFGKLIPIKKREGGSISRRPRTVGLVHKPQDDGMQELFDYYIARCQKKYGGKPVIRSCQEAKTLLRDVLRQAGGDKQKVMRMLDIYLADDRPHYRKMAHSLEVFKQDMQQLAASASAKARTQPAIAVRMEVSCAKCLGYFELVTTKNPTEMEFFCEACKGRGSAK